MSTKIQVAAGVNAIWGETSGAGAIGVTGINNNGYGVRAIGSTAVYATKAPGGYASLYCEGFAVFINDLWCYGYITKAGGGFLIDHPLDPENKVLEHSFVESSERRNLYDGIATADANGNAEVRLPDYFEALNEEFRYQATPVGAPAPSLHVKKELSHGSFALGGLSPGQRVSWQVTGRRKDASARANPLVPERAKSADEVGFYLHPDAFGFPEEKRARGKGAPRMTSEANAASDRNDDMST